MRISVVVPAHNEAGDIAHCLERLIEQDGPITEIIVVDNNSTDETPDLVREAAVGDDRVVLITEPRPGVAYARYAGFAAATGDVIVSVDSDTRVEPGWSTAIASAFSDNPRIAAGTCPMVMFDLPFQGAFSRRNLRLQARAQRHLKHGEITPAPALSGANSAIRRTAWDDIADKVSYRGDLFEDLDRSLLLQDAGHSLAIVPGMAATVSGRRLLSGPRSLLRYAACGPRTYAVHGKTREAAIAWVLNVVIVMRSSVLLPANRAWDPDRGNFSLRRLLAREWQVRHSPIG
ncbi:glycosyltransferase family 2 protein [Williamsia deligens]|uniref:4,4'-diaponeurosporenoate glycosyltransferase n=1 Tax=Williamsia deligens TaxID=321325 RepID=A0ABW3GD01_9NOCA|nr:glycosyltransferase family A protein [Williamsia deligens]MCP2192543.1 Glycosyl transferase family 2 [Williamsia deligens]